MATDVTVFRGLRATEQCVRVRVPVSPMQFIVSTHSLTYSQCKNSVKGWGGVGLYKGMLDPQFLASS